MRTGELDWMGITPQSPLEYAQRRRIISYRLWRALHGAGCKTLDDATRVDLFEFECSKGVGKTTAVELRVFAMELRNRFPVNGVCGSCGQRVPASSEPV